MGLRCLAWSTWRPIRGARCRRLVPCPVGAGPAGSAAARIRGCGWGGLDLAVGREAGFGSLCACWPGVRGGGRCGGLKSRCGWKTMFPFVIYRGARRGYPGTWVFVTRLYEVQICVYRSFLVTRSLVWYFVYFVPRSREQHQEPPQISFRPRATSKASARLTEGRTHFKGRVRTLHRQAVPRRK